MSAPDIPSGYCDATNPEVSAHRTAEMQRFYQGQVSDIKPTRNLTIIWDDERQALLERIVALEARTLALEQWAQSWANGQPLHP